MTPPICPPLSFAVLPTPHCLSFAFMTYIGCFCLLCLLEGPAIGNMLKSVLIFYHVGLRGRPLCDKLLWATEESWQPHLLVVVCLVQPMPMITVCMFLLHTVPLSLCASLVSQSGVSHGVCPIRGAKDEYAARAAQCPSLLPSLNTIPV